MATNNPPEDQLLFQIGWMADSFAGLELQVVNLFAYLINAENPRVGEVISDRLSLHQTTSLIEDLLKLSRGAETHRQFKAISSEVDKAAAIRNDILHSTWLTPSANDTMQCDIIQERARKRHMGVTGHELDGLLRRIEEGVFFVQDVAFKIDCFANELRRLTAGAEPGLHRPSA